MELGRGTSADVVPVSYSRALLLLVNIYSRYEREINRAERPAIRRIQEHDASAAQAMVLCVSNLQVGDGEEVELELTDGWYCIRTVVDKALARAARKGKLAVGRKIAVTGARVSSLFVPRITHLT
jgi:breast cancer 2 susceptibility protein